MTDERIIPEMSPPTKPCPEPGRWHAFDDMSSEVEVLNFLTFLVAMLKPAMLIETGCFNGHGSEAIIMGMAMADCGVLYTCDLGHQQCEQTRVRLERHLPTKFIYQCSGLEMIEKLTGPVDFAFLDSGMDTPRMDELRALYPKLAPGGVVAIHDTNVQFGMREFYLGNLLRELNMQHIYFDTPRGLTLCRKMPEIYP